MIITTKQNDPIADIKLADAYFRWALLGVVDVVGDRGLNLVLKMVGMERYTRMPVADTLEVVSGLAYNDLSRVMMGYLSVFGTADQANVLRSGQASARYAMQKNGELFHPPQALKTRQGSVEDQINDSLSTLIQGHWVVSHRSGQEYTAWSEETEGHFYYHLESCPVCAGASATEPVCLFFSGTLMESLKWFTGRQFDVREVACRALNDPACVWQISKQPID
ncbi:MAG TPA: 4-vinyl reductase [Anaerolineales bacterium]|jgi:hypothetical protein|nr:4-vinyl reductase [Anaerolineales bacterium]